MSSEVIPRMRRVLEFRGTRRKADQGPLVVGCGMAAVPCAVLAFALATGQVRALLQDDAPRTPAEWLPHLAFVVGWAVLWSAAAGLLYQFNSRGLARRAAGFRIRLDSDGLEFTDRGRTWRSPWTALRMEYQPGGEETDSRLLYHGPSGTFEDPCLLERVDCADYYAALRVLHPAAPLDSVVYTPEIQGMLIGLQDLPAGTPPGFVRDLCGEILAKAEAHARGRYGMIPVLDACERALVRAGLPQEAAPLGDRAEALRREIA